MSRRGDGLLLGACALSGAAALGYELLWTRLLGLALGAEILAVFGVLAGFFGGTALGALVLHGPVRRCRHPLRLYALLEVAAAIFALASPHWLTWLARTLPPAIGPLAGDNDTPLSLVLTLGIAAAALLPATFCLGATLPALVEGRLRRWPAEAGSRAVGRLYGLNTLGATAGVLLSVHLLMPRLGLVAASAALAALGLASAGLAWIWWRAGGSGPAAAGAGEPAPQTRPGPREGALPGWLLYAVAGVSGLAGLGLELLGVRVLAQVLENTVFTFAHILAVFLVGTGLGAAIYARRGRRASGEAAAGSVLAGLLLAQALCVLLAGAVSRTVPWMLAAAAPAGAGETRQFVAELVVAAAVLLPSTLLSGALFSHVVGLLARGGAGRPCALNTLGAALAPFVCGLWAIPTLGYGQALYLSAWAYLALFVLVARVRRFPPTILAPALALVLGAAWLTPTSLGLVQPRPGWTEVSRHEGLYGVVLVTGRAGARPGQPQQRRLQLDRHFRMGGRHSFAERRMGHLPLLLSPGARRVLFLGVGTGATLGAVRAHPVRQVDAVEIVPGILRALPLFDAINNRVRLDRRVRLHAADARRFVAASSAGAGYDLVVADLFHPGRDGAGLLYSLEHFQQVRRSLRPGALLVQWLPLYQLDLPALRCIVRTFLAAFPETHAWLGIYNARMPILALAGRNGPRPAGATLSPAALDRFLRGPAAAGGPGGEDPPRRYVLDARDLLASHVMGPRRLARFAGPGPLNTDLRPRLLFDAPASAYEYRPRLALDNLAALLPLREPPPRGLWSGRGADGRFREALDATFRAVGLYLRGDLAQARAGGPDGEAVRLFLEAYEADPDLGPARGTLLMLAIRRPPLAGEILARMLARTPDSPRVLQVYLAHLRRSGDRQGYLDLLRRARRLSDPARSSPDPRPRPRQTP
jgi:spermidine synthase